MEEIRERAIIVVNSLNALQEHMLDLSVKFRNLIDEDEIFDIRTHKKLRMGAGDYYSDLCRAICQARYWRETIASHLLSHSSGSSNELESPHAIDAPTN